MFWSLTFTRRLSRLTPARAIRYAAAELPRGPLRVLVVGVYVANKPSTIEHLVARFAAPASVSVEQRWAAIRGGPPSAAVAAVTRQILPEYRPKWQILGDLIGDDWQSFDYVIFCDDDITVGDEFLDRFLRHQQRFDFALAQPARTWRSYTDWPIVRRRLFTTARQTRFVEGGPLVSMRRDFLALALPFGEESPMGWGYDLVWPVTAQDHGLRLGIVDATPIDHSLRPRGALYAEREVLAQMSRYLSSRRHMQGPETFRVVTRYR